MQLLEALKQEARLRYMDPTQVARLLREMHEKDGLTWREVGEFFSASEQGILYHVRRLGLQQRTPDKVQAAEETIRRLGFDSPLEYFLQSQRQRQSFTRMARQIGISPAYAREWYDALIQKSLREEPERWQKVSPVG